MKSIRMVLATTNAHKVAELHALFSEAGLDVDFVTPKDVGVAMDVEEVGMSFAENATIKALAIHAATGLPTIADDSGIEVDALGGAPGIYSARFAGEDATDADNRNELRHQLDARHVTSSAAQFRCVLCYVDQLRVHYGEGTCVGRVDRDDHGEGGFGYDPLFTPEGHDRTFGEMSSDEKHALSHRGRAVQDLVRVLKPVLVDGDEPGRALVRPLLETMMAASIHAVRGDEGRLRATLESGLGSEQDGRRLYEVLLQSYLFAGFPVALESLSVLDEVMKERYPEHRWDDGEVLDVEVFRQRGEDLCRQIYGSVYDRMMEKLEGITPDLSEWMVVEGYGKTLSRPHLSTIERELCIVAQLAVLQRERQLVSHVRGALNVGAGIEELHRCRHVVTELAGDEAGSLLGNVIDTYT
jgi:XTP/dITP diphosphohydrolase